MTYRIQGLLLAALSLLLTVGAYGQACNATSPNIGLNTPGNGCYNGNWDVPYNANWNAIDNYLSGNSTAPFFKTQSLTVTGLTVGNCVQAGTGGLLTTTSSPCSPGVNFTYSGSNTTKIVTFGTWTGGAGAPTCKDAAGNLTTIACSSGAGGSVLLSPAGNQSITTPAGFMLNTNVLEQWVFADAYGPSSSGGINEAFAACGNSGHCVVWAPIGTTSACNISVPSGSTLRGHGRHQTSTNLQCGTTNAPVIADVGSNSRVEHLTVSHSSSPISGGDGVVTSGDRVVLSDIKSFNNWNNFRLGGVSFAETYALISEQGNNDCLMFDTSLGTTTMQWVINGGLYQKCAGWGIDFVNSTATNYTAPRIVGNVHVFGNHLGGVRMQATSTGRVDNFSLESCNLSQNDGDDVLLDTGGETAMVSNCHIEQSGGNLAGSQVLYGFNAASGTGIPTGVGNGVKITSNCSNLGAPPMITGNRFYQNANDAILTACAGTVVANNDIYDPGYVNSGATNTRAGISVQADNVVVTGNLCQQGGTRSLSCIDISNNADKPSLTGNMFTIGYNDSTLVSATTQPANGFREHFGTVLWIQNTGAPTGACINGSLYSRTDTGALYVCQAAAWALK